MWQSSFFNLISVLTLQIFCLWNQVKARKRLTTSVLSERVKVLDDHQTDSVFHGFRPLASSADL